MSVKFKLVNGVETRVDRDDLGLLGGRRWYAYRIGGTTYVRGEDGVYLHRVIMKPPPDMEVDHINRNGLDNRRENLRVVSHLENLMNTGMYAHNTSGYRGVTWYRGGWMAQTKHKGVTYSFRGIRDKETAAIIRDLLVKLLHPGIVTFLNFPDAKPTDDVISEFRAKVENSNQPERWEFIRAWLDELHRRG